MSEQRPPDEAPIEPTAPPGPPPGFAGPPPGLSAPAAGPPTVPLPGAPSTPPRPAPARRSIIPLLLLGIVVLGLAAFGVTRLLGGDDEAPSPGDAAAQLASAIDARDGGRLCSLLSDQAKADIEERSGSACRESLRILFAAVESADPGPFEVVEVERDGDRATVRYRWAPGTGTVPMELDGDTWLVASADGLDPSGGSDVGADPTGSQQACLTEQRTVETAAEAYNAIHGEYPADVQALVDDGLLRELPTTVEIQPDGTVVPIGACA